MKHVIMAALISLLSFTIVYAESAFSHPHFSSETVRDIQEPESNNKNDSDDADDADDNEGTDKEGTSKENTEKDN